MKHKLFIDTISNRLVLALIKSNQNIVKNIMTNKNMTEIFIKEIDMFLKSNNTNKCDISELYIVNGPGNFTGVRLGTVFANTLKVINNIKIFSITSCEFQQTKKNQLSIIDAKSNLFYIIYNNKIEMLTYSKIEEIANERDLKIVNNYLSYNFNSCWLFNKHKFRLVNEVVANYVKDVI